MLPGPRPSAFASALRKNQFVRSWNEPSELRIRQKNSSSSELLANSAMTVPDSGIAKSSSEPAVIVCACVHMCA